MILGDVCVGLVKSSTLNVMVALFVIKRVTNHGMECVFQSAETEDILITKKYYGTRKTPKNHMVPCLGMINFFNHT